MKFVKTYAVKSVLIATALLTTGIAQGADSSVADAYMKVYTDSKASFEELGKLYSKDVVFRDPTSDKWGEYAWNIDGRSKILEAMKTHASQFDEISISYRTQVKYTSSGHTVYTGKVKLSQVKDNVLETICSPITTIISVRDGKVVEHRDYVDYDTWESSKKKGDQDC